MTPRLQRLRMRIFEYDFTISHVPGKHMYTADVLSRKPLRMMEHPIDSTEALVREYEMLTVDLLPASVSFLDRLRSELKKDPCTARVMTYCEKEWPGRETLPTDMKGFASLSAELSITQGLLMRNDRLVIPQSLQKEVLERLHCGHQGVVRCRARARDSAWWPGISKQIQDYVSRCKTCIQHRRPPTEPLLQTPLPDRPWQELGTDIFEFSGKKYIVVVDYYSKFIELEELSRTTTEVITKVFSQIFARHGCPEVLHSDNGPPFRSNDFQRFANEWGVKLVTSSPYYAQSNGEAERAVQTAKHLLSKSPNVAQALLAHRTTPGPEGLSPAELLMGRKLRSTVPTAPNTLTPRWHHVRKYRRQYGKRKTREALHYNRRHRTRDRSTIPPHSEVWIRAGAASQGRIHRQTEMPWSYVVETSEGTVRRTSRHL